MAYSKLNVSRFKKDLEKRRLAFRKSLNAFIPKYGEEMVDDFFYYWSEADRSYRLMRCERETSWEIDRRLRTWAKRQMKIDLENQRNARAKNIERPDDGKPAGWDEEEREVLAKMQRGRDPFGRDRKR